MKENLDNICAWKEIANETKKPEGALYYCGLCNGLKKHCESYTLYDNKLKNGTKISTSKKMRTL
jgi:hypothetical protein